MICANAGAQPSVYAMLSTIRARETLPIQSRCPVMKIPPLELVRFPSIRQQQVQHSRQPSDVSDVDIEDALFRRVRAIARVRHPNRVRTTRQPFQLNGGLPTRHVTNSQERAVLRECDGTSGR